MGKRNSRRSPQKKVIKQAPRKPRNFGPAWGILHECLYLQGFCPYEHLKAEGVLPHEVCKAAKVLAARLCQLATDQVDVACKDFIASSIITLKLHRGDLARDNGGIDLDNVDNLHQLQRNQLKVWKHLSWLDYAIQRKGLQEAVKTSPQCERDQKAAEAKLAAARQAKRTARKEKDRADLKASILKEIEASERSLAHEMSVLREENNRLKYNEILVGHGSGTIDTESGVQQVYGFDDLSADDLARALAAANAAACSSSDVVATSHDTDSGGRPGHSDDHVRNIVVDDDDVLVQNGDLEETGSPPEGSDTEDSSSENDDNDDCF